MTDQRGPAAGARAVRVTAGPTDADLGLDPLLVDPATTDASLRRIDDTRAVLERGGGVPPIRVLIARAAGQASATGSEEREVVVDGWRVVVTVEPERRAALRERATRGRTSGPGGGPTEIRAMIPGRVVAVAVAAGDSVAAGQRLLVVEAMKMQNELRAPRDGRVVRVDAAAGTTIELGDVLVVIE
jgi:biotin carboxyl carrier protein